jgi:hypothetical protein
MEFEKSLVKLVDERTNKLDYYRVKNKVKELYLTGENRLKNLRVNVPEGYEYYSLAVAWPEIVVERMNERMNLTGYTAPKSMQARVRKIFRDNYLDLESKQVHRDALTYGVAYAVGSFGDTSKGEPELLVTMESPNTTIGTFNKRSRDLDDLLMVSYTPDGFPKEGVLQLRNKTITFTYENAGAFVVHGMDLPPLGAREYKIRSYTVEEHNRGYIVAQKFVNRPRSSRPEGQSEITKVVMDHTDQAVVTYLQAALAREVYATPQRFILNAPTAQMKDKDGNVKKFVSSYYDQMMILGGTKDSPSPIAGQFDPSSPAPLLDLIRSYAQMISAASGIPLAQLGFAETANPASADAIVASAEIGIKSAEDRMDAFGVQWTQLMLQCIRLVDGELPEDAEEVRPIWRSAAMPTKAADADAAVKLIQAEVLHPDSEVTWTRLGFSESEKQILREEKAARAALPNPVISPAK